MSNIIKAKEYQSIQRFDFRDIAGDVTEEEQRGAQTSEQGDVQPEVENQKDSLAELEEMIQSRLLETERRAQELEKEAYASGYAQGERDGLEYGKRSLAIVKDHLEKLLSGMQSLPERVLEDYREWLIATSITIARSVLRRELATRPEAVADLVKELIREAEEGHSLTIHLSPKDLELLERHMPLGELLAGSSRSITLKPDSTLERGGCRLESDVQVFDASLDVQLARIEKAMRERGPECDAQPSE